MDELDPELLFEAYEATADRRLRDVERSRRACEAPTPNDLDKGCDIVSICLQFAS